MCTSQKGCTRLATASDKVYELLAHGRSFSPGTPVSSTTKTGRHDIVALKSIKSTNIVSCAPTVTSDSGFSILDCPLGFLSRLLDTPMYIV